MRVPDKFFKKLENTDGIYEVRVITTLKSIRLLCFLDNGNLIILTNGFIKKTQKTPKKEIDRAERMKEEYLRLKNDENKNT
jgi:phage-related protein